MTQIIIAIALGLVLSAGIIYVKFGRKPKVSMGTVNRPDGKKDAKQIFPNTFLYSKNKIGFIFMENPVGPSYPASDGRKYYHAMDFDGTLVEWQNPHDNPYAITPDIYAEALTVESVKEYLMLTDTTFQKISMGIMAAVILCECIAFALV